MKRYTFSLFFLLALVVGLYFEPTAQAIPAAQRDCDTNTVSVDGPFIGDPVEFIFVPNSVVTVDNGTVSRNCVITFSAEASADETTDIGGNPIDSTLLIRYSVDGGACNSNGPEIFHQGELIQTNTNVSVRNLGSGTHTIRPCFASSTVNGGGSLFDRCLVVECQTQ